LGFTVIFSVLGWGLLGSFFLLLLHHIIALNFPRPPAGVLQRTFIAQQPPSEEEGDGLAAIYSLDRAIMNAELDRPGSTFWLYYRQPGAVIARILGSLLVSLPSVAWILGSSQPTCGSLLLPLLGLGLSVYPYLTWWMSRPTLRA
jgi:hypothetical protein